MSVVIYILTALSFFIISLVQYEKQRFKLYYFSACTLMLLCSFQQNIVKFEPFTSNKATLTLGLSDKVQNIAQGCAHFPEVLEKF